MANSRTKRLLAAVLAFMMVLGDVPAGLLTRSSSVYAEDQTAYVEEEALLGSVSDALDDDQAGEDAPAAQEVTSPEATASSNYEVTFTEYSAEETSNIEEDIPAAEEPTEDAEEPSDKKEETPAADEPTEEVQEETSESTETSTDTESEDKDVAPQEPVTGGETSGETTAPATTEGQSSAPAAVDNVPADNTDDVAAEMKVGDTIDVDVPAEGATVRLVVGNAAKLTLTAEGMNATVQIGRENETATEAYETENQELTVDFDAAPGNYLLLFVPANGTAGTLTVTVEKATADSSVQDQTDDVLPPTTTGEGTTESATETAPEVQDVAVETIDETGKDEKTDVDPIDDQIVEEIEEEIEEEDKTEGEEEPTEVTSEEAEGTEETTEDGEATEGTEETTEEGEETEGTGEDSKPADEELEEESSDEETQIAYPAVTLSATVDGTVITADIPENALPEGIQMKAGKVDVQEAAAKVLAQNGYTAEEARAAVQTLVDNGTDLTAYVAAYDVSFYLPENPDAEIEPAVGVTVTFGQVGIAAESGSQIEAYHVSDEGSVDTLNTNTATGNGEVTVTVVTDTFSTLIVTNSIALMSLLGGEEAEEETPLRAGEDGEPDMNDYHDPASYAAALYGGENPIIKIRSTSITPGQTFDGDLAGGIREYVLLVNLSRAHYFESDYYGQMTPLFDWYKSNVFEITMPAGLLVSAAGVTPVLPPDKNTDTSNTDTNVPHVYQFEMGRYDATKANEVELTFTVYLANNGTSTSVKDYTFETDFYTEFDIIDFKHGDAVVGNYRQHVDLADQSFSTRTPDVWGIKKDEVQDTADVILNLTSNPKTATFKWRVLVGLKNGEEIETSDPAFYRAHGRDEIKSITLKDTFGANWNKDSGDTDVDLVSATIAKIDASGNPGTPVPIPDDGILDLANGSLALDRTQKTDTDNDSQGDYDVAVYTYYEVTTVYKVTDDMIADFSKNKFYTINADNTAKIDYQLWNQEPKDATDDAAWHVDLPIIQPGHVKIIKKLNPAGGGAQQNYNDKYGPISYTLTSATAFMLYTNEGTAQNPNYQAVNATPQTSYSNLSENKVYYVPVGTNVTVSENLNTKQEAYMDLVSEGSANVTQDIKKHTNPYELKVVNKEDFGSLKVTKRDDGDDKVTGAKFTLTRTGEDIGFVAQTLETTEANNAIITFSNLPAGTYKLTESTVPPGYTHMAPTAAEQAAYPQGITYTAATATEPAYWTIVIDDTKTTNTLAFTAKNKRNEVTVRLRKKIGIYQTTATEVISSGSDAPANMGTFVLERSTNGTNWETVTKDITNHDIPTTTSAVGQNTPYHITADVEAFDNNGNPYQYRFKETVPEGYYYISSVASEQVKLIRGPGDNDTVYSEEKAVTDPTTHLPSANPVVIPMANWKPVTMEVQKRFRKIDSKGQVDTTNQSLTTTVTLYSTTDASVAGSESTLTGITVTDVDTTPKETGKSGTPKATYDNLPVYTEAGQKIYYLIKEADTANYYLDNVSSGSYHSASIKTINGQQYVVIDITAGSTTYVSTLYNYQKAIPVIIYKKDSYTGNWVANSFFTIKDKDGAVAKDTSGNLLDGSNSGNNGRIYQNGRTVILYTGQKYTIEESTIPSNYFFDRIEDENNATTTEIDLTSIVSAAQQPDGSKVLSRTVYNKPYPNVTLAKLDSVTNEKVSGKTFDIYIKNETTGEYTQNTSPASLTGNTATRIKPGTYYFLETNPGTYLDPTNPQYLDLFKEANGITGAATDPFELVTATINGKEVVLIKVTVVDGPTTGSDGKPIDNKFTFTFKNIPNKGDLVVEKWLSGVLADRTSGNQIQFTLTATYNDGTEDKTVEQKIDVATGKATFTGLPVYDANGQKIVYTISETLTTGEGGQDSIYYKDFDGQTAVLTLGTTTTTDNMTSTDPDYNHTLHVNNEKYMFVSVTKKYYDTWNYAHGGYSFPMEGATIALYKLSDDGTQWVYVSEMTTNGDGVAAFNKLPKGTYAVIEVSGSPDHPTMDPYQDGAWKTLPGTAPATISASGTPQPIAVYNYATTTDPQTQVSGSTYTLRELYNKNHWVQFHITKYRDDVANRTPPLTVSEFDAISHAEKEARFDKLDHVPYSLYRKEIGDNDTSVTFNSSLDHHDHIGPPPAADGWEFVNSYSTGQYYSGDAHDERQKGQLITDVLTDVNKNYVYLLVEDNVGPNSGTRINPNFKYTFWYSELHPHVTCNVTGYGNVPNWQTYEMDTTNHDDLLNDKLSGPGLGETMLASFRLAKWREDISLPDGTYKPLSNAVFTLKLDDGTYLGTLTSGKEGYGDLAMAQSSTFALLKIDHPDSGGPGWAILKEYEPAVDSPNPEPGETPQKPAYKVKYEKWTENGFTVYAIPVKLRETSSQAGYGYSQMDYMSYLCFVDKTPNNPNSGHTYWFFSDAYYVKPATDSDPIRLAEEQGSSRSNRYTDAEYDDREHHSWVHGSAYGDLRIVNYPMENPMVTVHKFGYDPFQRDAVAYGKTAEQLFYDTDVTKVAMEGVKMKLQREVSPGTWSDWDWVNDKEGLCAEEILITAEGTFQFRNGLRMGKYRLIEVTLGNTWSGYENAYPSTRPRVFTVPKAGCDVYMANPAKFNLKIKKVDAQNPNTTVSDLKFTLTPGGEKTTGSDGTVTYTGLSTGTYKLTESYNGTNYSTQYFAMYADDAWKALAGSSGMKLGYEYTKVETTGADDAGQDWKVTITPAALWDQTGSDATVDFSITVKNPRLINVNLKKVDEDDETKTLSGAKFDVYRLPFTAIDGTMNVTLPVSTSSRPWTSPTNVGNALKAVGATGKTTDAVKWSAITQSTGEVFTTGTDGLVKVVHRYPGIYAFVENTVPTGYDRILDTENHIVVYYAVVYGGMDVRVTGIPSTTAIKTADGTSKTVQTLFTSTTDDTVTMKVPNRPKYPVQAKKTVKTGDLGANVTWEIKLNSYKTVSDTSAFGTGTINQGIEDWVYIKPSGNNNKVYSQGTTYYLAETVNRATISFNSKTIDFKDYLRINNITPEGGTALVPNATKPEWYEFVCNTSAGLKLNVENQLYVGQITFTKYDEDTIDGTLPEDEQWKIVSGAKFKVYAKDANGTETEIPVQYWSGTLTDDAGNSYGGVDGNYTVLFPLTFVDGDTPATYHDYVIREVEAPDPFLTDTTKHIDVSLSAEHNKKDYTGSHDMLQYIANNKGRKITVKKYASIYDESATTIPVEEDGKVRFTIYHQLADDSWETVVNNQATNSTPNDPALGTVSCLAIPGDTYAVSESFESDKYLGFNCVKVYDGEGNELIPEEITIDGSTRKAYKIINVTSNVYFNFYNQRYLKPIIVKNDETGDGVVRNPQMDYSIYLWTKDTDPTDAEVEALVTGGTPVFSNHNTTTPVTVDKTNGTVTTVEASKSTMDTWQSDINSERWDYTKRYVLVETKVYSNKSGITYNTMNKDDSRVHWYRLIPAVPAAELNLDPDYNYIFDLDNVYTEPTVDLTKEVVNNTTAATPAEAANTDNASVNSTVDSLLSGDRKVIYKLTPTIEATTQPLVDFTLTDDGITFTSNADAAYTGPQPDYDLTAVDISAAGMGDTTNLKFTMPTAVTIKAQVTFLAADGITPVGNVSEVTVSGITDPITVEPTASGAKKVKIVYYSPEIQNASEAQYHYGVENYGLVEGFYAGPVQVYATVKQTVGTKAVPTCEVEAFNNTSNATLRYPKWNETGTTRSILTPSKPAEAPISVLPVDLPYIEISKAVNNTTLQIDENNIIVYTITVHNKSTTMPYKDPVVLDLLPTGVSFLDYAVLYNRQTSPQPHPSYTTIDGDYYPIGSGTDVLNIDKEKAIVFEFAGDLDPDAEIVIKVTCEVGRNAAMYGIVVENDAYASSNYHSYYIYKKNPHGYSFRKNGQEPYTWNSELPEAAQSLGEVAANREGRMHNALENTYESDDYVYVAASASLTLASKDSITLAKAVKGDQDTNYIESAKSIATSSRTNLEAVEENGKLTKRGYVDWRLTCYNWKNYVGQFIAIGDAIPKHSPAVNESRWDVIMPRHMTKVVFDETTLTEGTDYWLYFYTGDKANVNLEVDAALQECNVWGDVTSPYYPAWPERTGELRPGWHRASEFDVNDSENEFNNQSGRYTNSYYNTMRPIRAFILVFDKRLELNQGKSIVTIFRTPTENITSETDFFNRAAFENAANYFYYVSARNQDAPLDSNIVSVTLMDGNVSVEGDLWIDEDWSGVQKHYRNSYDNFAIVQALKNNISFSLTEHRNVDKANVSPDAGGTNPPTDIGESIKHFTFNDLYPAYHLASDQLYTTNSAGAEYIDSEIIRSALKTTDPYTYFVKAAINKNNFNYFDIVKLTDLGLGNYVSDDPSQVPTRAGGGNRPSATENALDNNFRESSEGNYYTRPFYLRYGPVDRSKDIGFRFLRRLELLKVDKYTNEPIQGAVFNILGPYPDSKSVGGTVYSDVTHTAGSGTALKFLQNEDGSYTLSDKGTITDLVTDANGKIVVYDLNWFMEYDIKEKSTVDPYVLKGTTAVPDTSTKIVDHGNGLFTLLVPAEDSTVGNYSVTVKNPPHAEKTINIPAKKTLIGASLRDHYQKFRFSLTSGNVVNQTGKTCDADGQITFDDIKFVLYPNNNQTAANGWIDVTSAIEGSDKKYVLVLTLKEDSTNLPSYITKVSPLNPDYYTITLTVTYDKTKKELNVARDPDQDEPFEFKNQYEAKGTATVQVAKHLTGRDLLPTDEFKFTLSAVDGAPLLDADGKAIATGSLTISNGEDGILVDFPTLNYFHTLGHSGKTYIYKIVEEEFNIAGVTRDTTNGPVEIYAKVEVPADNATGSLGTATVTYYSDAACTKKLTKSQFVNKYEAKGTATVQVAKHLTGRDLLPTDEFKFTLSAVGGAPLLDADGNAIATASLTITNGEDGVLVNFPTLNYFHALGHSGKTYIYKIVEEAFSIAGVSRDTTNGPDVIYAKVEVPADTATSTLGPATVTYYSDAACTKKLTKSQFVNKYEAKGTATVQVAKHLTGRDLLPTDEFKFTLSAVDGAPLLDADGKAITTASLTIKNGEDGVLVNFPTLNYFHTLGHSGKTYIYKIVEEAFSIVGVTRDTTNGPDEIYAKVEVPADNATGSLGTATVTYYSDAACTKKLTKSQFVNQYESKGTATVQVAKHLTGRDLLPTDEFKFTLSAVNGAPLLDADGNAIATTSLTITNGEDGVLVDFPTLNYFHTLGHSGKTYIYKIVEEAFSIAGVTRDTTNGPDVIYAKVEVPADNATSSLGTATVTYYNDAACTQKLTKSEFVNKYGAKGTATVQVAKHLTGRDLLPTDEFKFTLSAVEGAPLLDADGNAIATTSLTITNGEDGVLVDFPTLNYFHTLGHSGKTYIYKIVEEAFSIAGVTRDTTNGPDVIYAKVEVPADNATGSLGTATVTYYSDAACTQKLTKSEFVNQYESKGTATVQVAKHLTGRDLLPTDEFKFTLSAVEGAPLLDADGNAIATASLTITNGEDGVLVDFPTLNYFHTLGHSGQTYIYKIVEEAFNIAGVTRDTINGPDEIYAKVEIPADTATSKLEPITVTYYSDAACTKKLTKSEFVNQYEAKGTATVQVAKHLTGRDLLPTDEYKFTLSAISGAPLLDADGNAIATASLTITNGEDGVLVDFPTLNFFHTLGHSGQTYVYKIVEEDFNIPGVTRDTTTGPVEIYAKVVVPADNASSTLEPITVTYYSDATCETELEKSEFVNAYEATGTATVQVAKHLTGRTLLETDEFKFTLSAINGAPLLDADKNAIEATSLTIMHGADGVLVSFPTLNYFHTLGHSGQTYVYKIVEEDFNIPGVTRDTTTGPVEIYAKVVVPADNATSKLEPITVTYYSDAACETELEKSQFVNEYDAKGSIKLGGDKIVQYRDFMEGDTIKFTIERVTAGAPMPTIIEEDGSVTPAPTTFELDAYAVKTSATVAPYMFEAINYWLVDAGGENGSREYTYKITETYCKMNVNAAGEVIEGTEGAIGKVKQDQSVYLVAVKVTDSTTDHPGNLKVEVTKVTKDGAEVYPTSSIPDVSITVTGDGTDGQTVIAKGFNFNNPYQTDAKVNVEAQKILTGRNMAKDEFTFNLYLQEIKDAEDKVIFAVNETQWNEAAPNGQPGAVTFSDIKFVLNPDSNYILNPTADGANSGYWDVSKLIDIDKPQPVTWTLKLTEEITTQMPIGVKPLVSTFDVKLTLKYDRTTGKLTAEVDKDKVALTFENDFTPTEKGVVKFWDDENDQDGLRPDHLNVHLKWYYVNEGQANSHDIIELKNAWLKQFADIGVTDIASVLGYNLDEMKDPYVLNKGNHWSYMVTGLPTTKDGLDIDYFWTEDLETNDYGVIDPAVAEHLTIFKNKHDTLKTSVSAEKVWADSNNEKQMRESIEVQLYANGKAYGKSVVLSESNGWKHTWPDLPLNANPTGESSDKIKYTVEELNIPEGYIATITGDATTGFVLTNTLPEEDLVIRKTFLSDPEEPVFDKGLVNIPVTKIWVDNDNEAGMRPNVITVHLFAGGTEIDTATLTAANGWTHLFRDLPIYNDDEQEITYSVTEDAVPNYISEVDGYNITNTYQGELISVAVQKVWDDDNNAAGKRPRSIVMTLSNGMRVVLNDANGWTAAITGLPAYIDGQPAVYTWTEQTVAGYTQSSSVTTGSVTVVTNSLYNRIPPSELIEYDTPLGIVIDVNHVGDCFD